MQKKSFQKVSHKIFEATGGLTGNKIAEKIGKPKSVSEANSRNFEETVIPPAKRQEILKKLRRYHKMEQNKICKL